jgi:imidazolonepropionase
MTVRFDKIWLNAQLATLVTGTDSLGIIDKGAVATANGRIVFVGTVSDLPTGWDATERVACDGRLITPGLIDCHTHLVYGGHRAHEFELRLQGATYEEIARAGGGIVSTVMATRAASEAELVAQALPLWFEHSN